MSCWMGFLMAVIQTLLCNEYGVLIEYIRIRVCYFLPVMVSSNTAFTESKFIICLFIVVRLKSKYLRKRMIYCVNHLSFSYRLSDGGSGGGIFIFSIINENQTRRFSFSNAASWLTLCLWGLLGLLLDCLHTQLHSAWTWC